MVRLSVRECREWPARAGLSAVRAEVFGDLRNQMPRMDSPMSEANGWDIGSGAVESGCKTVVGQRLRGVRDAVERSRRTRGVSRSRPVPP